MSFIVHREGGALRMSATSITSGPSAALATFQLFDFLTAGEFAPREGAYRLLESTNSGEECASSAGMHMNAQTSIGTGQHAEPGMAAMAKWTVNKGRATTICDALCPVSCCGILAYSAWTLGRSSGRAAALGTRLT